LEAIFRLAKTQQYSFLKLVHFAKLGDGCYPRYWKRVLHYWMAKVQGGRIASGDNGRKEKTDVDPAQA
jgi:hypothetical protein